jgi:hypothetical protein
VGTKKLASGRPTDYRKLHVYLKYLWPEVDVFLPGFHRARQPQKMAKTQNIINSMTVPKNYRLKLTPG